VNRRKQSYMNLVFCLALGLSLLTTALSAQAGDKVDFEKDVQPLLRQNCAGCHGPKKQKAGMRLDRRSSALKKFARRVVPGSSENSMVYHTGWLGRILDLKCLRRGRSIRNKSP
jgi:hypothetical protein